MTPTKLSKERLRELRKITMKGTNKLTHYDQKRALLCAIDELLALRAADGREWQPIETAPKGKMVLVCGGTYSTGDHQDLEAEGVSMASWHPFGWRDVSEYDGHEIWHKPTHWQPMPSPHEAALHPRASKGAEEAVCETFWAVRNMHAGNATYLRDTDCGWTWIRSVEGANRYTKEEALARIQRFKDAGAPYDYSAVRATLGTGKPTQAVYEKCKLCHGRKRMHESKVRPEGVACPLCNGTGESKQPSEPKCDHMGCVRAEVRRSCKPEV